MANRLNRFFRPVATILAMLGIVLTSGMTGQQASAQSLSDLVVETGSIQLVGRGRAGRRNIDWRYTVDLTNQAAASAINVTAVVTTSQRRTKIRQSPITFGSVAAGQTVTSQTEFIIRTNLRGRPDTSALSFVVAGEFVVGGGDVTPPVVAITVPADGAVLAQTAVDVSGTVDDAGATVAVNGVGATVTGNDFTAAGVPLTEGPNTLTATATDAAGNAGDASISVTRDTTPPVLAITAPADGVTVAQTAIDVSGTVDDAGATVNVNGVSAVVTGNSFTASGVPLTEGPNTLTATGTDAAGNAADVSISVARDTAPPVLAITSPADGAVLNTATVDVTGTTDDAGAAISVNGVAADVVGNNFTATGVPLVLGANTLTATGTDGLGNSAQVSINVTREAAGGGDTTAPVLAITSPADGDVIGTSSVDVTGTIDDPDATVSVNGVAANVAGNNFTATGVPLVEGANTLTATGTDAAGNVGQASISVTRETVVTDTTPPVLQITAPTDGDTVETSTVDVSGTTDDTTATITVNGVAAALSGTAFTATGVPLAIGPNTLTARGTDAAGNVGTAAISITRDLPPDADITAPVVTITSPPPQSVFSVTSIDVEGTIDDDTATVTVNGVAALVSAGQFTASGVPIAEGGTFLTATAVDPAGNTSIASVQISRDTTAPRVQIGAPSNDAVLTSTQITVVGMVNDIVSGGINPENISVEINGRPATVSNGSFELRDLLLVRGLNTIRAVARDTGGNESETSITVDVRDEVGQQRIVMIAGNNQQARVTSPLTDPLIVEVQDADGDVVAGVPVTFTVLRSDGLLFAGAQNAREVTVFSDEFGRASTLFQLGSRTGAGTNQVAVSSTGFIGEIIFCETSQTAAAGQLNISEGDSQRGVGGQALPIPLRVKVTDNFGNSVAGTDVTFDVIGGGGNLSGGASQTVATDLDGMATAVLTLGLQSGINNNLVMASFEGLFGPAAIFQASAVDPETASAENTSFSGVVLDMGEVPISGATVKIPGDVDLIALTDTEGRFFIPTVPVGALTLLIDATTSPRQADEGVVFTGLAFEVNTLPGVDNTVGQPIRIPILDAANAVIVGGDEDMILTMDGVAGVEYTIFAHSATFPNGDRVGPMTLTQIPADRVPMPPRDGSAPALFATLQPAGVAFEPPVRVQTPNADGFAPGQVVELQSFDHDLEQFVTAGPARVTADGAFIISDPGFGIVKSGWHGNIGPPPPKKCTTLCDDKNACTNDSLLDPPCKCENKGTPIAEDRSCGSRPGVNACIDNGFCAGKFCIGDKRKSGSCDDGLFCTDNDQCDGNGVCKGDKIGPLAGIANKSGNWPFLDAINKGFKKIKDKVPPLADINVAITGGWAAKFETPCCERKNGSFQTKTTLGGNIGIAIDTGKVFAPFPPWSNSYSIGSFELAYGVFFQLTVGLTFTLENTWDNCTDVACWTAKLTGAATMSAGVGAGVSNPAVTTCGEFKNEPCAAIAVFAFLTTGIQFEAGANCTQLFYEGKHLGLKGTLQFLVLEGTRLSFTWDHTTEFLPPIVVVKGVAPLPAKLQ